MSPFGPRALGRRTRIRKRDVRIMEVTAFRAKPGMKLATIDRQFQPAFSS